MPARPVPLRIAADPLPLLPDSLLASLDRRDFQKPLTKGPTYSILRGLRVSAVSRFGALRRNRAIGVRVRALLIAWGAEPRPLILPGREGRARGERQIGGTGDAFPPAFSRYAHLDRPWQPRGDGPHRVHRRQPGTRGPGTAWR